MLKALELCGFKSFADKTRFDFPPGITVIVGPNGSGKSNVVDAIKWVLGEQSAKSLRGKDMSDVIFKGSGDGRRMLNTAEATIIFDNSNGHFPFDAPEVHITRRVYRSGEGEYLINRQPCRLKDIKELIRGSGAGADAYSLIEQGKVDRLLQASPKDRRMIFEEAAGISRFKAKKIEAQRRLERVDQNLLRLSDIVEEVESRLRSVRSQASKARRYREYSERLQQLRTQVGWADWQKLSDQIKQCETEAEQLAVQAKSLVGEVEQAESRALALDGEVTAAEEQLRQCESQSAHNHEQIALSESARAQGYQRIRDLDESAARYRSQLAVVSGQIGALQQRLSGVVSQLEQATRADAELRRRVLDHQQALASHAELLGQLRRKQIECVQEKSAAQQALVELGGRQSSRQSQLETHALIEQRSAGRQQELEALQAECAEELATCEYEQQQLTQTVDAIRQALAQTQAELESIEQNRGQTQDEAARSRQQVSAVTERAAVLEELERSQEGLADGVRDVLELARESEEGPFSDVQGLVADLVEAEVDVAPIIDIALGERAQHIVISSHRLLEEIQAQRFQPAGRVGFVCLDAPTFPDPSQPDLFGLPGVIDRLDNLIRCSPSLVPAMQRLLGRSWLVETLQLALALRRTHLNTRFVTWAGDLLDSDGTVAVGPRLSASGLISRRSQLHALRIEAQSLLDSLEVLEVRASDLDRRYRDQRELVAQQAEEFKLANEALSEQRVRTSAVQERYAHLQQQVRSVSAERLAAQQKSAEAAAELELIKAERTHWEQVLATAEQALHDLAAEIQERDRQREEHALQATAAKVELEKSHEQLDVLRTRVDQLEADQRDRKDTLNETQQLLADSQRRAMEAEAELLQTSSRLALLYLDQESLDRQKLGFLATREQLAGERAQRSGLVQSLRRKAHKLEESQHRQQLAASELHHQRKNLADRLREDYGIEISQLEKAVSEEDESQRLNVEEEIADLRKKINQIGSVNLDALGELDELEERFANLSSQYQDLTNAKAALERIIVRINADSRRLFQETLEAIRANFQVLYRKSFGGGKGDIVLEEGVDPLEAGIDIIATPPGKPSFNNSLLSGGEKALTAVALLLGIFEYRPSPFCVLDEVDAPFDEANVGRFIDVLKSFLGWTKFIIVTHSKKTMTAANTLYGVTMQESGVSKQVSVRFEDVSEDGHISQEAIERSNTNQNERGVA